MTGQIRSQAVGTLFRARSAPQHSKAQMLFSSPSHGENRGSSPLGSASKIKRLFEIRWTARARTKHRPNIEGLALPFVMVLHRLAAHPIKDEQDDRERSHGDALGIPRSAFADLL